MVCPHFIVQEYKEIIALVQLNILATDLANHLKALNQMEAMSQTGYDRGKKTHHELLSSLIMTSCDLCNACKDWEMTQRISVSKHVCVCVCV